MRERRDVGGAEAAPGVNVTDSRKSNLRME